MILYNGKIYTMDNKEVVQALKIDNDKIIKVGKNEDVLALKKVNEECINLEGKTVIPGLNDSHMHLYGFGAMLKMVNLMNVTSIKDIITKVQDFINVHKIPQGSWVRGRGWNQDYFTDGKTYLTKADLDKISKDHPIILSRACGHMAVVNSKALEVCGIDKMTNQVEGGEFDLDLGIFKEHALGLIMGNIPKPTIFEIKQALMEAMKYANSKGLTSVQTDDLSHAGTFSDVLKAYEQLRDEGKLTCRIYEQCLLDKEELLEFISLGYKTGVGDEYFKIGPYKILSDGSLGARTAALSRKYADDISTDGVMCYTQEILDDLILTAHQNGFQIATHCIGDRAMKMVLDSYEKALTIANRDNHRHGIIHCQITTNKLIKRFKELNILAYIQPIFLHYDLHIVEDRVGKELAETSYAFKTFVDTGIHTSLGTDCPVEALDTMSNIYCAVNRCDLNGNPIGGWNPQEKLSVYEALFHYTQDSAYASFSENIKGSLSEGKLADFVVLSDDIMEINTLKIKDIKVLQTYVGGKLVYQDKEIRQ